MKAKEERKLFKILSTFTVEELKQLGLYINSPYFNKNTKIIQLFEILEEKYIAFATKKITDKELITFLEEDNLKSLILPQKKNVDFRVLMSFLTKLIENYLVQIQFEKNEHLQQRLLLNAFSNRRMSNLFEREYNQVAKENNHTLHDIDFFYHQFQLEDIYFQYKLMQGQSDNTVHKNLSNLLEFLDIYFVTSKLRYANAVKGREAIFGEKYNVRLFEEVLTIIEEKNEWLNTIPLIRCYFYSYQMSHSTQQNNEKYFHLLKDTIIESTAQISPDEARQVYNTLINFCTKNIKKGKTEYLQHLFLFYKQIIQQGYIYVEGYIGPNHYKNAVIAGLRLNEIQWTEQFIENQKQKLEPKFRESVYHYCAATLHFTTQNYGKALTHLLDFKHTDTFDQLNHKALIVKTYYELKYFEAVKSAIDTFRVFLLNNQNALSKNNYDSYRNFVNIMLKFYRIKTGGQKALGAIQKDIENTENLIERQWLMQKTQE